MFQPPTLGNNRFKEYYTTSELARMFGVQTSTVLRIANKRKCGISVGHGHHFSLEHISKIYYGMSYNAQKRYDNQFKK